MFIIATVIASGLVSLGQASLLIEKSREQTKADFLLSVESETLRSASWSEVETQLEAVKTFEESNRFARYGNIMSMDSNGLGNNGMTASVIADQLNSSGETGKILFHITLNWNDRSGRAHEESRVIIVTEGGFSADS